MGKGFLRPYKSIITTRVLNNAITVDHWPVNPDIGPTELSNGGVYLDVTKGNVKVLGHEFYANNYKKDKPMAILNHKWKQLIHISSEVKRNIQMNDKIFCWTLSPSQTPPTLKHLTECHCRTNSLRRTHNTSFKIANDR